jgi:hypothetical protein
MRHCRVAAMRECIPFVRAGHSVHAHHARLVSLLRAPDQFRLAAADRSYIEVEAANHRVQQTLIRSGKPHPGVTGVGIGMAGGQFVIRVDVENLTDEVANAIRATVAPDVIVVESGQRARRG